MAANSNNSGRLSLTANFPGSSGRNGYTVKYWMRDARTGSFGANFGADDGGSNYFQTGIVGGPQLLVSANGGAGDLTIVDDSANNNLLTNHWICMVHRFDTTTATTNWARLMSPNVGGRGRIYTGTAGNMNANPTGIYLSTDGFAEQGNAIYAGFTIWNAVLATSEVLNELNQIAPVRQRDLFHYESLQTPLIYIGRDVCGTGRNFTRAGTWALSNFSPPVPEVASPRLMSFGALLGG